MKRQVADYYKSPVLKVIDISQRSSICQGVSLSDITIAALEDSDYVDDLD